MGHKMKLFLSVIALASASNIDVTDDRPCGMTCMREFIRDDIKCDNLEGTEEEKNQCAEDAFRQFWSGCLGDVCGKTMPDGRCGKLCTPPLEDGIAACDDLLESGEINQIEHYKCVMGPGGPADTWERCFAQCTCDSPWCNCTPPEVAFAQTGYESQLHLRDTTITCYPDKL